MMFLGLDLGTSALKGVIVDDQQKLIASATAPLALARPRPGWSEQDPASWIAACEQVFEALKSQVNLGRVQTIGLSGQMHGATALDRADAPLWPCMLWNDTRAARQAQAMDADPAFRAATGNIMFPGFTAPKIAWLREEHAGLFESLARVLLPKDYLRLWLTGEAVSDMSDAAGTGWLETGRRSWSADLLGRCGLSAAQMPSLVEGSDVSGHVRTSLAQRFGFAANLPVAGGGGDNAATALGVGAVREGEAFVSLGTSGVLFAANDGYRPAPETAVHTFCHAVPERWHQMGVILAASDALAWYGRLVGQSPQSLTNRLGALQAPGKALFLPYLGGERTPINDASVRGAFLGLGHGDDQDAGTRAVLEGVSFALRDCQEALAATGTHLKQMIAVGGGSQSAYWLEAIATVLNVPIHVPQASELGAAFGAARLAMMAAYGEGEAMDIARPPKLARLVEPTMGLRQGFEDGYARYSQARDAIRRLS